MKDYPTVQYSRFINKNDQLVIRTETEKEFTELTGKTIKELLNEKNIEALNTQFPDKSVVQAEVKPTTSYGFKKQEAGEVCNKCKKAKIVLNPKSGKTFCEAKCWLNGDKTY